MKENSIIFMQGVTKKFKTLSSTNKLRNFFFPKYQEKIAVNNISFEIKKGERVALIGPNGAGKSTTIKMMTGVLHKSSGDLRINGLDPITDRKQIAHTIGTVIGHRSQLWYQLPAIKSFELLATIYSIPKLAFRKRLDELSSLLQLDQLMHAPVKELSLGQRIRCEVAASLLHKPDIIFLDEPTIGLDVISKSAIRSFIKNCSEENGTTVFLTSHDTSDIEAICDRVIIIDKGTIVLDSKISEFIDKSRPLEEIIKEIYLRK